MIQKLTVPPILCERCDYVCPFYSVDGHEYECTIGLSVDAEPYYSKPGPECVPGEYAVMPVAELDRNFPSIQSELCRLRAEVARLKELVADLAQYAPDGAEELFEEVRRAGKENEIVD